MASLESKLIEMLEPAVQAAGYELWGLEFVRAGRHSTLRVFIDHENGITVDDCADCSRQMSAVLDVEDPISSEYNLEVSSPGMDRPLFTLDQYKAFVGQDVSVKTRLAQAGQRKFSGTLLSVDSDMLSIQTQTQVVDLMFENIEKGNLLAKF